MNCNLFPIDRKRCAFTSIEMVVASGLLVSVMAIMAPLAVRTSRLWQDSRRQQIALQELTTEIERLTALDSAARADAMQSLSPSESLISAAPNVVIKAETVVDNEGTRIVLTLDWNELDYPRAPMRLVGWLDPLPPDTLQPDPLAPEQSP